MNKKTTNNEEEPQAAFLPRQAIRWSPLVTSSGKGLRGRPNTRERNGISSKEIRVETFRCRSDNSRKCLFKPSLVHFDNVSKRAWLRLVLKLSKNSMTFVVPMVGSFQSNAQIDFKDAILHRNRLIESSSSCLSTPVVYGRDARARLSINNRAAGRLEGSRSSLEQVKRSQKLN